MSEVIDRLNVTRAGLVRKIKWLSRMEIVLWAVFMVPSLGVLLIFIFPILFYILLLLLLAIPIEIIINIFRQKSAKIPDWAISRLNVIFDDMHKKGAILYNASNMEYIKNDFSVGAQVRGVISPKIIVSAGLLVAVQKEDASVKAILSHELAHIAHFDRLMVGVYALWCINTVQPLFFDGQTLNGFGQGDSGLGILFWLTNVAITFAICCFFSRKRELAADASAALVSTRVEYCKVMARARGPSMDETLFHPSMVTRYNSVVSNPLPPFIFSSKVIMGYVFYGVIGFLMGNSSGYGHMITCLFGLFLEITRYIMFVPDQE